MKSSELGLLHDLESRNYSYRSSRLRDDVGYLDLTRALGVCMAGNHCNRFEDIRRVRLSNTKLGTLSAARIRSAKLFVLFESSSEVLSGFST
eukprot:4872493-Pyramimonas_sp.AAC.1